ncbi:MAG: hypothetical protein IJW21_02095, partial [Clostridia bacterium]|nr:hypothetical protein [Clostridia bacterium]
MKKFFALALALIMSVLCLASCGNTEGTTATTGTTAETTDPTVKSEGVMTYAEYDAAALDTQVVIEAFV